MFERLSDDEFRSIQTKEFGYWQHTPYPPTGPWRFYDQVFATEFLGKDLGLVLDVGSGPVPYFLNAEARYRKAIAVDPLAARYKRLGRYESYWAGKQFEWAGGLHEIPRRSADTVFALNVLDHARSPHKLMADLQRVLKSDGLLFLFCDVDKPPDGLHPHKIPLVWLVAKLRSSFVLNKLVVLPSWKFANDTLYFVGRLRA